MMKLALFDFDGTIADSFSGYLDFYNLLCSRYGVSPQWSDKEEFREWVSGDWRENVRRLGLQDRAEETNRLFREHRARNPAKLQDGLESVLKAQRVYAQGVLSAENAGYITDFLVRNGLRGDFKMVLGADNLTHPKPSPEALREARNLFGVDPEEVVYIGDTVEDIMFSKSGGSKIIAVSYGWNPRTKLEQANPDYLVDKPEELQKILGGEL